MSTKHCLHWFRGEYMPRSLAADEVELIDPKTTPATFDLLRVYHSAEWMDKQGRWHVVITRAALAVIEETAAQEKS